MGLFKRIFGGIMLFKNHINLEAVKSTFISRDVNKSFQGTRSLK